MGLSLRHRLTLNDGSAYFILAGGVLALWCCFIVDFYVAADRRHETSTDLWPCSAFSRLIV